MEDQLSPEMLMLLCWGSWSSVDIYLLEDERIAICSLLLTALLGSWGEKPALS